MLLCQASSSSTSLPTFALSSRSFGTSLGGAGGLALLLASM